MGLAPFLVTCLLALSLVLVSAERNSLGLTTLSVTLVVADWTGRSFPTLSAAIAVLERALATLPWRFVQATLALQNARFLP